MLQAALKSGAVAEEEGKWKKWLDKEVSRHLAEIQCVQTLYSEVWCLPTEINLLKSSEQTGTATGMLEYVSGLSLWAIADPIETEPWNRSSQVLYRSVLLTLSRWLWIVVLQFCCLWDQLTPVWKVHIPLLLPFPPDTIQRRSFVLAALVFTHSWNCKLT